jgi:hypothetical protein
MPEPTGILFRTNTRVNSGSYRRLGGHEKGQQGAPSSDWANGEDAWKSLGWFLPDGNHTIDVTLTASDSSLYGWAMMGVRGDSADLDADSDNTDLHGEPACSEAEDRVASAREGKRGDTYFI